MTSPNARFTAAELLMWELGRAYGLREGLEAWGQLIDENVAAALDRPDGHGGPYLDELARRRARDLFRRYLLVTGGTNDWAAPRPEPATSRGGGLARMPGRQRQGGRAMH